MPIFIVPILVALGLGGLGWGMFGGSSDSSISITPLPPVNSGGVYTLLLWATSHPLEAAIAATLLAIVVWAISNMAWRVASIALVVGGAWFLYDNWAATINIFKDSWSAFAAWQMPTEWWLALGVFGAAMAIIVALHAFGQRWLGAVILAGGGTTLFLLLTDKGKETFGEFAWLVGVLWIMVVGVAMIGNQANWARIQRWVVGLAAITTALFIFLKMESGVPNGITPTEAYAGAREATINAARTTGDVAGSVGSAASDLVRSFVAPTPADSVRQARIGALLHVGGDTQSFQWNLAAGESVTFLVMGCGYSFNSQGDVAILQDRVWRTVKKDAVKLPRTTKGESVTIENIGSAPQTITINDRSCGA